MTSGEKPGLTACENVRQRAVSGDEPASKFYFNQENGVRISGGVARGVSLTVPKGDAVRPATDGMRQAVFSSLGARVAGAVFLDLFAGSGAYGLEALSRGASAGAFVEKNAKATACLRQNIAAVCKSLRRDESRLRVLQGDALEWPPGVLDEPPDLVFVDPPYDLIGEVGPKLFARLGASLDLTRDPVVVFEMPGEMALSPDGWKCVKRLGRGARQPTVAFFKASREPT